MKYIYLLLVSLLFFYSCENNTPKTTLENIFDEGSDQFKRIISEKDKYEVQVLFSPIRNIHDSIYVEDHFYNFRPDDYFYPASTVKIPVSYLALQKIEKLKQSGLDVNINTPLTIDSLRESQSWVKFDSTSNTGMASIAHYIDRAFLLDDDDSFNRLYEFTTQDYINSHLHNKGIFTNSRIVHRLPAEAYTFEENKWAPSINFLSKDGEIYDTREPSYAQGFWLTPVSKTKKGVGYIDKKGNLINEAFDFSKMNFINIRDLQESLKRMILLGLYPEALVYDVGKMNHIFALEHEAIVHQDSALMKIIGDKKSETYFSILGNSNETLSKDIKIKNVAGCGYGYVTECAYIQDSKNDVAFFLTATIYVNENQIYNDDQYEYDSLGKPFLGELAKLVHQYMIEDQ